MPNCEELKLALKHVLEAPFQPVGDGESDEVLIDERPTEYAWNQGLWIGFGRLPEGFCLTAGCLAGHVAINDGFVQPLLSSWGSPVGVIDPMTGRQLLVEGPDEFDLHTVAGYAMEKLGLNEKQANRLFDWRNTRADLTRIVDELCAEANQ